MSSSSHLDSLRSLQDSIARQREESDRLEARIQASYLAASNFEAERHGSAPPPPKQQQWRPTAQPPPTAPRPAIDVSMQSSTTGFDDSHSEQQQRNPNPLASAVWDASLPSATLMASDSRGSVGDDASSVASRSVRSSSRAGSPNRVQFRSPIYRSASPSRRVGKDRVVTSNLARAPRFRESKADVPGPGKYDPHATDFGPTRVAATPDLDGKFGHTWSSWYANKGLRPSLGEAHEAAITAATARLRPDGSPTTPPRGSLDDRRGSSSVASRGGGGLLDAEKNNSSSSSNSPRAAAAKKANALTLAVMAGNGGSGGGEGASSSRSRSRGGSSGRLGFDSSSNDAADTQLRDPSDPVEVTAVALIRAAGGNARTALEAALRREHALRLEVEAANKAVNSQRLGLTSFQAIARGETSAAEEKARAALGAIEGIAGVLRPLADMVSKANDAHVGVQRAVNELGTALAAEAARAEATEAGSTNYGSTAAAPTMEDLNAGLSRALAQYPSLGRMVEAARAHDTVLSDLSSLVSTALSATAAASAGKFKAAAAAASGPRSASSPRSGSSARGASSPRSGAAEEGFIGYSSLSAALATNMTMGTMGPSDDVLRALAGTGGEQQQQRERGARRASRDSRSSSVNPTAFSGLTSSINTAGGNTTHNINNSGSGGSRGGGGGYSPRSASSPRITTSPRAISPSEAASRFGRPTAFKGLSAASIAAFASAARAAAESEAAEMEAAMSPSSAAPSRSQQQQQSSTPATRRSATGGGGGGSGGGPQSGRPGTSSSSSTGPGAGESRSATGAAAAPNPPSSESRNSNSSSSGGGSGGRELSVADTLAQLFSRYATTAAAASSSRSRDGADTFATLQPSAFLALLRDAGALDNSFGYADARAIGRTPLSYSDFISALSEVATAKFSGSAAEAFRSLLRVHILPLHAHVTSAASSGGLAGPGGAAFIGELTGADMQAFFAEQAGALLGMFAEYAVAAAAGGAEEHRVLSGRAMGKRGLVQWASDYKMVPELISRAALTSLAKEVAAAAGPTPAAPTGASDDSFPPLSYPQFLELVALLAFALGDPRRGENSTLSSLGELGSAEPPLLHRVYGLFYHCYSIGAKFAGESAALLRKCATELRELMAESEARGSSSSAGSSRGSRGSAAAAHAPPPRRHGGYFDETEAEAGGYTDDVDATYGSSSRTSTTRGDSSHDY